MAAKGKYKAVSLARMNMIIKLVHIPAYLLHFAIGIMGLLLGIFGFGFIFWAILIDLLTIGLSGMVGISACVSARKEGLISKSAAVLYAFMSFTYCVDFIFAIVLFVKSRKSKVAIEKEALSTVVWKVQRFLWLVKPHSIRLMNCTFNLI